MLTHDEVKQSADFLRGKLPFIPEIGIVLGSGLGPLAEEIEQPVCIPYGDIPHFRVSTAPDHAGRLVCGTLSGRRVVCMQGRLHGYEGYAPGEIAYPVYVLRELGIQALVVTNASGGINTDGLLTCRTTASFEDSAASRIIRMVRDSAEQKGSAERFITRFSKIYTPAVVIIAAALALLPPLLGFGSLSMWISRALVFLVASCPCALVVSVPLTFFAGVGTASRAGVLVKGTRYLEALAQTDCAAFDKTGTLTLGAPAVSEFIAAPGFSREELLPLAAAAEQNSNHPAAKAVLAYAGAPCAEAVSDFTEHPGMGVSLTVGGRKILCGSARLFEKYGVDRAPLPAANVLLAVDGRAAGAFLLADRPREEAKRALSELRALGVGTIAILTGDAKPAAEAAAAALGIDTVRAGLMPGDKAEQLTLLQQSHRSTVFVGDGINDAPVLVRADVGIAMGLGTDTAIESADVVLVRENLTALPAAIRIARRTVRKARENIAFALTVKLAVLLLGAMGLATMWMAVFADVGVSILAILNSLTLLRKENACIKKRPS